MSEGLPTVFVVDDDAAFLSGIERMLRATGYTVACFASAADFLAKRPPCSAGCVVADLQMPGMDGMALQRALAGSDEPVPIVFLTGQGDISTTALAMRHGAEDFPTKTAPREALLAAIERALARDALASWSTRFTKLTRVKESCWRTCRAAGRTSRSPRIRAATNAR